MEKRLLFIIFLFLFLPTSISLAAPSFFDPVPADNAYIYGKSTDVFSINITESSLDTSSVKLHIRVDDPTSVWSAVIMNCVSYSSSTWYCNTTVSGLDSLVHDGNWILYFFDGNDTSGGYGNFSSESNPLRVRIDRSPPVLNMIVPGNYSSGRITITLQATDLYIGVNQSSVFYSFDNSTWLPTSGSDSTYTSSSTWDTTSYTNNQTVIIYQKAADLLSNLAYSYNNTTVENEPPTVIIVTPTSGQIENGAFSTTFNLSDYYSGVDIATLRLSNIAAQDLDCNGDIHNFSCSANFDSSYVSDGDLDFRITVEDNAENEGAGAINLVIDNLPPTITIISPSPSSTVRGVINITATVTDAGSGTSNSTFRWESSSVFGEWNNMSCSGSPRTRSCTATWNTRQVVDGTYRIRVSATDGTGKQNSESVQIGVVNTGLGPGGTTGTSSTSSTTSTTTTTTPTSGQQTGNLLTDSMNKIKEIFESGITGVGGYNILLPIIASVIVVIAMGVILVIKKNVIPKATGTTSLLTSFHTEDITESYKQRFDSIYDMTVDSFKISNLDELKDRIRVIIIRMKQIEKDTVLNKIINRHLSSIKDKKVLSEFKRYVQSRHSDIENLYRARVKQQSYIFDCLNDIMGSDDIKNARSKLTEIKKGLEEIKTISEKEVGIVSDMLNKLKSLK